MGIKLKVAQKWIYANMVWLLIVFSALLFILSRINVFVADANDLLEKASFTILSSGVFAAVLKSLQFTGIFKNVIEEIMLGTDFIENRSESNQQGLWKATSKAIYKKKFPELSNLIEDRILESYLPTQQDFYYRDYITTINISEITDDFEVCYIQTTKFDVVLDENLNEAELISSLVINEIEEEEGFINEMMFYKVDGIDLIKKKDDEDNSEKEKDNDEKTVGVEIIEEGNKVITKVKLESKNGKKVFKIHRRVKRKYSLKNENYKLVRMGTFTKGIDVVISFPKDVSVSFFNIGNVNFFEAEHSDIECQISRSHRNDVILPYQGFGMSFELNR